MTCIKSIIDIVLSYWIFGIALRQNSETNDFLERIRKMKTKKYWIWVIVSFSILVVVWPAGQITGKTGLSAKEKKTDNLLKDFRKSALSTNTKALLADAKEVLEGDIKLHLKSSEAVFADDKEVLQGLKGVLVVVQVSGEEIYNLREQNVQTDTELQLRQYGVKVLTREEFKSTPLAPMLRIKVGVIIQEGSPMGAASMSVELREPVIILREPTRMCVWACTWQEGSVVSAGLYRIKEIRGFVKDFVNEFINDYLAANPKDGSIKTKGSLLDDFKPKDHSTKKKGSVFDDLKKSKDN